MFYIRNVIMLNIDLNKVPENPWVYFFKKNWGKTLYIWKTKNLKKRVSQYFSVSSVWKQDMVAKADKVEFVETQNEQEAIILETNLIKEQHPPYNNLIKWEWSYVYIKITNEDFPQIFLTRFKDNDWATYIGPKSFRHELKHLLQIIKNILMFRTCKKTEFQKWTLCGEYFFNLCKWWCVYSKLNQKNKDKYLSQAKKMWFEEDITYQQAKEQYKKDIKLLKDFFEGKSKPLEDKILQYIQKAIKDERYERAAKLRDAYQNIQKFVEKQTVVVNQNVSGKFYKLKKVWDYFVIVVLNFFQGKLIDIIRKKEKINDLSIEDITIYLNNEFWEIKEVSKDENQFLWYSASIKKIKKEDIKEIDQQMESFIDSFILSSTFEQENLVNELLNWIKERYETQWFPHRIEFIDISHLSWWWVSGGLSCMVNGILYKKWYRKFRIKAAKNKTKYNNDYEAIKEVITRRFKLNNKNETTELPDMFIIDGWKGQLGVLKELLKENEEFTDIYNKVEFASLGKWETRKKSEKLKWANEALYKFDYNFNILEYNLVWDEIDKILIRLRDEAHRFANKYRQQQMSQEFKK